MWTDFKQTQKQKLNRLQFARMQFVRNEWQETPIRLDSLKSVVKLSASTINTEDNPEYFSDQCPGALKITDENGNLAKETSLKLSFDSIQPGDTAVVRNVLVNQTINLSAYTQMTMWVHGDKNLGYKDDLQYIFRFGNDDSTYYEYRSNIYVSERTGWDSRNVMTINLHDFSKWKEDAMAARTVKDSLSITQYHKQPDEKEFWYSVKYRNNRPPNFAGITWIAIGVTRSGSKNSNVLGYSGELWVDELKVSGVHDFNGWASRIAFNSNWEGFMNLGGRVV
jgi:cell surface protein SprA